MKYYIYTAVFFLVLLTNVGRGQTILNHVFADLQNLGNGTFSITFTPLQALSGFGNPINIYLKIPQFQAAGSNITVASTNYSIARISAFSHTDNFYYFYFQGQPAVNLATWPLGVPKTIATFQATGPLINNIILSGGDFGLNPIGSLGRFFWPGTSLATDNTNTNLIGWPILEAIAVVLPVEFTTFTAEALRDETALLKWETATELNNDYFQIEHSADGVNFAKIGLQKGAGTSFEPQSYQFVHPNPRASINYYRLKQVDIDGTFDYSEIRSVNFAKEGTFQVYPNPSTNYVQIVPPAAAAELDWNVDVFDIQGRLVQKFNLTDANFRLSTANWPSGVYHLQLRSGQRVEQLRFVKE